METDHDNTKAAIEFLAEVNVPCLICGFDVEINKIIKRKIAESKDCVGNNEEFQLNGGNEIVDNEVFHGFLKTFGLEIVKKGKSRSTDTGYEYFNNAPLNLFKLTTKFSIPLSM